MKNLAWVLLTLALCGAVTLTLWVLNHRHDLGILLAVVVLIASFTALLNVCIKQTVGE